MLPCHACLVGRCAACAPWLPSLHRPLTRPHLPTRRLALTQTGLPFVDACMRELASTGFMSNRGRQNVASLLSKARPGRGWLAGWVPASGPRSTLLRRSRQGRLQHVRRAARHRLCLALTAAAVHPHAPRRRAPLCRAWDWTGAWGPNGSPLRWQTMIGR